MNKQTWIRFAGLALVAGALSACGGGGTDAGCSVFSTGCSDSSGTTTEGNGSVDTTASGTLVLSLSSATISASTPGIVTALVKDSNGKPLPGTVVAFEVSNGSATASPVRSITDEQGNASTTLQPVAGMIGADFVKATADVSTSATTSSTLTTRAAFTVSAVNVALGDLTANPAALSAYAATVISVPVTGASSSSPVTVTFSSNCASASKAALSPAAVTVTGSSATTTYQDKGCGTTDRLSAQITGTSQSRQIDLVVAAPTAQSLVYMAATPEKICLAGSGCPPSSQVSFKLQDQYGNPIANRKVLFSIDIPGVATLGVTEQPTGADGIATVSVTALTTPSPVRVKARVEGTDLVTVSNQLVINAGLPTSRTFSFSADVYNPDGMHTDGTNVGIRVQLNDRFGNPVSDGTAISFVAEGASVIPASCTTTSGVCTVKLVTSEFRPSNGRVTILAYAKGEEAFNDINGDNLYTLGEWFEDLGPIFIDKNENGVEELVDGEHIKGEPADGHWSDNNYVRINRIFTLSSDRLPRVAAIPNGSTACPEGGSGQITALTPLLFSPTPSNCRVSQLICIRDWNTAADQMGTSKLWDGNPIPVGSTVSVASKAKGASVRVDNTPIPSTIQPTVHRVTVELDDCTKNLEAPGSVDLTVRMSNGRSYIFDIGSIRLPSP